MAYVRARYGPGGEGDTPHIQNKVAQTLTYIFLSLYAHQWQSFFSDFLEVAGNDSIGDNNNLAGTMLYLRLLGSIHDEIADVLIARSEMEMRRNMELKDLIRGRDAQRIAVSWQEILAKWRQTQLNVVEMCLKTVSRWVSWIDISLVVNQTILDPLLQMAGQQGLAEDTAEVKVRDAAIEAFTEIASKKMRPQAKVELIKFLNLNTVVGQLVASAPLSDDRNTSRYDTDLAELVARLVNNVMRDVIAVLNSNADEQADEIMQAFVPYVLRFFSDEYDEVCSTVIDSITDLLQYFRKFSKAKSQLPAHYSAVLPPILEAIISKMKYDETASWGEEDEETDEAEFQELRKRLAVLQQTVASIDETLYMNTLSGIVAATFDRVNGEARNADWRDLDLALHELYLFGDLAVKQRGLYQKKQPSSVAAQRLIEMMIKMLQSSR
jgi:exportin-T